MDEGRPNLNISIVNKWLMEQIHYSNQCRDQLLSALPASTKRKVEDKTKDKSHRRPRRHSSSEPSSSSSSSSGSYSGLGTRIIHAYRELDHKQPGVLFAAVTADFRSQLGQRGVDFDVGPRGPVYKKSFDSCFTPSVVSKGNSSQLKADRSELTLLIKALDEFRRGRILEVGDILGIRLRALAF